jgi:CheY-like chemotaxis protein
MTNRAYRLLIVEDNEDDLYLTLRALSQKAPPHVAVCCRDGEEAGRTIDSMEHAPDLVLLDMGLPKVDGLDLLAEIRRHPALASTPVLVLSTSGEPGRTLAATHLGGIVIQKPVQYEAFIETIGNAVASVLSSQAAAK